MKVPIENLDGYVAEVLKKLNDGCLAARNAGIQAELPEFVDFQVEVVHEENGITRTTEDQRDAHEVVTNTQPGKQVRSTGFQSGKDEIVETREFEESGGGVIS